MIKKLSYLILLLISLAVICFGTCVFLINTDKGQNYIINFVKKIIAENTDQKIEITNLEVSWSFNVKSKNVAISDKNGKWLDVENFELAVQPLSLLKGVISISKLKTGKIIAHNIPEFNSKQKDDTKTSRFDVSLEGIALPLIIINSKLANLDHDVRVSLKANLQYSKLQELLFDTEMHLLDDINSLLKNLKVAANGSYNVNAEILKVNKVTIATEDFRLNGTTIIELANQQVNGKYDFECSELAKINKGVRGQLADEISISGTFANLILNGKLKVRGLEVYGTNFSDSELNHELNYVTEQKTGDFKIFNDENDLELNANFKIDDDNIKINQSASLFEGNEVLSNINYDLGHKILTGNIDIQSSDISILSKIIGYQVKGEAKASLNFSKLNMAQSVEVGLESKNFAFDDVSILMSKAKISIYDLWQLNLGSVSIKLENITFNEQEILKIVNLNSEIKDKVLNFNINGSGKLAGGLEFKTKGDLKTTDFKSFTLDINKISAKLGDHKITNLGSTVINYDNLQLKYNLPGISIDGSTISAHGELSNENVASKILFKQLPLSILSADLPQEFLNSKLNGEIQLSGGATKPLIDGRFKISDLYLIAGEPTQLTLNSTYRENSLEIDSSLKSSNKDRNDFKIALPLKLSLTPFKLDFVDDENIKGYLNLNLNIDPIAALFLPPIHRLKGSLSAKLLIAGSLNSPMITGNAFIKGGKYEHATAGIKIKNISSHISALGKSVLIKEFTASDGDSGTFDGNGKWEINKKNMPYNITLKANDYFFLNHPNIRATISGNVKISGNTEQASIQGYVEPTLLEIQLPERFAKDILEINIVETVFIPGFEREVNSKNFLDKYKISTDISLNAKHKIFVRGWGLDAELGGKLTCKGFIEDPVIRGKLEVIRGRYQEFGKQFTLKSGKLNFVDSIPPAPYLDVIGSTIQDDVEIRIILSGPVLKPNLSIESNPAMPQEEVLSALLFGKQTTQISPFQALQLTDSLRRLSGQGGGSLNILNKARGILKVDDIKIKNNSSDPSNAALGIGKYLTDKVYLEIEKGTQVGSGKTKVEVEIRNNLSIESSVGESGSNSIGVNWRKDY